MIDGGDKFVLLMCLIFFTSVTTCEVAEEASGCEVKKACVHKRGNPECE